MGKIGAVDGLSVRIVDGQSRTLGYSNQETLRGQNENIDRAWDEVTLRRRGRSTSLLVNWLYVFRKLHHIVLDTDLRYCIKSHQIVPEIK